MISNINFQGHAKIDTKSSKENQRKLHDAIVNTKLSSVIEKLPDDVTIKYSSKKNILGSSYTAEFYKGEKQIGKSSSGVSLIKRKNFVYNFVFKSIEACKNKLIKANKEEENNAIIENIKINDGQVV